ncbi:MAG TPA: hypothetical protein VN784_02370 [Candidatus Limnocylindrales bacterium]|nr:hypothetical protein [Candidatus Limnocylindrales bacterium]
MKAAPQNPKTILYYLKLIGCVVGGAVSASLALIIFGFCIFSFHGADKIGHLLDVANPYVGLAGAVIGYWIFFRSTCKTSK